MTVARNPEAGTLILSVELPVEDGEVIVQALDRAVEAGETALGVEFSSNSWQAQQADALVAIAKAYLVTDTQATSAGDAYQVVLHVDEAALRGGIGRSDLPLDTIKRLTCDGSVIRVTEDESGTPLDIGRKKRTVTTVLKRALLSRDRGCSFPGCHHKKFVDAHHIRHWAEGGDTSLDNLMLLCTYHHRLLHEGGYAIKRDQDGEVYFERRDGRVIPNCGYEFGSQLSSQSDDPCVRTSHSRSTSAS